MKLIGMLCLAVVVCAGCNYETVLNQPYLTARQESAFLLSSQHIGTEIHATAEQERQWDDSFEWYVDNVNKEFPLGRRSPSEDEIAKDRAFADKVLSYATDLQRQRLVELGLQDLGYSAFAKKDVQAQLMLSSQQADEINQLVERANAKTHNLALEVKEFIHKEDALEKLRKDGDSKPTAAEEAQTTLLQQRCENVSREVIETKNSIVLALSDEQFTSWKKMVGAPFAFQGGPVDEFSGILFAEP